MQKLLHFLFIHINRFIFLKHITAFTLKNYIRNIYSTYCINDNTTKGCLNNVCVFKVIIVIYSIARSFMCYNVNLMITHIFK